MGTNYCATAPSQSVGTAACTCAIAAASTVRSRRCGPWQVPSPGLRVVIVLMAARQCAEAVLPPCRPPSPPSSASSHTPGGRRVRPPTRCRSHAAHLLPTLCRSPCARRMYCIGLWPAAPTALSGCCQARCKARRLHPSAALNRNMSAAGCGLGRLHASRSCHSMHPCKHEPRLESRAPSR